MGWKQAPKPDLRMNRRNVEILSEDISHDRAEPRRGTVQTRPVTRSSKGLSKGLSKGKSRVLPGLKPRNR